MFIISCFVRSHRPELLISFGQKIPRTCLRQRLVKLADDVIGGTHQYTSETFFFLFSPNLMTQLLPLCERNKQIISHAVNAAPSLLIDTERHMTRGAVFSKLAMRLPDSILCLRRLSGIQDARHLGRSASDALPLQNR